MPTALTDQSLAPQDSSHSGVTMAHKKSHEKGFLRGSACMFVCVYGLGGGRCSRRKNSFPISRTPQH